MVRPCPWTVTPMSLHVAVTKISPSDSHPTPRLLSELIVTEWRSSISLVHGIAIFLSKKLPHCESSGVNCVRAENRIRRRALRVARRAFSTLRREQIEPQIRSSIRHSDTRRGAGPTLRSSCAALQPMPDRYISWPPPTEALSPLAKALARAAAREDFRKGQAFLRSDRHLRRSFSPVDPEADR